MGRDIPSLEGRERELLRPLVVGTEALILSGVSPEESAARYEEALEIQERLLSEGVNDRLVEWAFVVHYNYVVLLKD